MPEHHRGLQFFQSKAEELAAEHFGEDNIIELALEALQSKRDRPVNYIVNMPEFKIDSNIEATKMFKKVNNSGAPYGVRPARPRSYLDFEK